MSITRRPHPLGSTRSSDGSPCSLRALCAAVFTDPLPNWKRLSMTTSPSPTPIPNHSGGPKPPTISSPPSNASVSEQPLNQLCSQLQNRDTSDDIHRLQGHDDL